MIVRTVRGDIDPAELGLTLDHDHLFTRPPSGVTDPDFLMDDEDAAVRECRAFRTAGGRAVVEMTTVDYGRDAPALARIARDAGVHIIAATGFNKGKYADRLSAPRTVAALAAWMIAELRDGVCGEQVGAADDAASGVRCGVIKASSGAGGANEHERKVFEAAIAAHHLTGAPISTHTEQGSWALEQAALFRAGGVSPEKVLIGHLDLKPELAYLLAVAATGVNLSFDQFGKHKYLPDAERVRLAVALVRAGHGRQLMLGGDMARRSYFASYGGRPGLAHVPATIRAKLIEAGLSTAEADDLLIHNPRRWLSFRV